MRHHCATKNSDTDMKYIIVARQEQPDFILADIDCAGMKRFELILQCIHFSNNDSQINNEDYYAVDLKKVFPLLQLILDNIRNTYDPPKNIALDESMLLWRGRLKFRQYIKSKKHKYGIKFYELCMPDGFYCTYN